MQDDRLLEALTVYETLTFTAKMKHKKGETNVKELVNKTIK